MSTGHHFACAALVALFSILLLVTTNSFVKVQTAKATDVSSPRQKPITKR